MLTITNHFVNPTADCKIPLPLECAILELKRNFSSVDKQKKYQNFYSEYADWSKEELLSRLRILCISPRDNIAEACLVFDKLIN
jgi:hypothetical protein